MRVLIVKMSAMGDIIHSLPVAALLKRSLPGLELDWLVEPLGLPLLQGNSAVDNVCVFEKKKWWQQLRSVSGMPATAGEFNQFISTLRSRKYDAAIDLQGLLKSSLLSYFSGAPLRFGFKGTREGAEHLLTHKLEVGDYFGNSEHVVDLNLRLGEFAASTMIKMLSESSGIKGGASALRDSSQESSLVVPPSIYRNEIEFPLPAVTAAERQDLLTKLGSLGLFGSGMNASGSAELEKCIVFIPGTTWVTKIWPTDKWSKLAKLCLEAGFKILLVGGPGERDMNDQIQRSLGDQSVFNLTGQTSIKELQLLFSLVPLVVAADTGPMHLAAAVGSPKILGIFGSTPEKRNGPYGKQNRTINLKLECQPCFEKKCPLGTIACLVDLGPELVFASLMDLHRG